MRQRFILAHDEARRRAIEAIRCAPIGVMVEMKSPTRSLEANALMWQRLGELAAGVDWYGQKLTAEEWKDVLSASLREQKVVPGINRGQFVILGQRTSKMTVPEMTEMLDCISAFGAEQGVAFRDETYALEPS
jgi:hypothetical protein